jgi:eukaryotic-like serine/threonine-protein kinase
MPAPASTHDFIDLVRKSDLIDAERMNAFERALADSGSALDRPQAIAQRMIREGLLTTFQAKQILQGKWRKFLISGKYKLLEMLGAGGMGAVYLCEHVFMRRLVALKVLPVDKLQDSSALERFYREARAAGALDHPNIVRAHDIDHDGNLHFLVMEFVEGSSLQEIVSKHGPMDVTRACHYIRQAALGLHHAHEAGLVHRDVKPGNLLLDRSGTVKVLDLGLARFFNVHKDNLTEKYDDGSVMGTADYLAPEQAMNNQVDIRSDLYSLGATFYFLLTGKAPFQEGTITQKLLWHQTKNPPTVREKRPDVPAGVVTIIQKLMSKSPADRYQTPQELIDALAPWTKDPIGPPPAAEMPKLSPAALKPWAQNSAPVLPPSTPQRTSLQPAGVGARGSAAVRRPPGSGPQPVAVREAGRETRPLDGHTRDESNRPAERVEEPAAGTRRATSQTAPTTRSRTALWIGLGAGSVLAVVAGALLVWSLTRTKHAGAGPGTRQAPVASHPAGAPVVIRPEAAAQYTGQRCVVEFQVQGVGKANTADRYFLNSLKDYRDRGNFTVTFTRNVIDELRAAGVADVNSYFDGKTIRVTGTITQFSGRPQIEVDQLSQIEINPS